MFTPNLIFQSTGYDRQDFDEGAFLVPGEDDETAIEYAEDQATKLIYVTPDGTSPIAALRNYREAFANLGDVNEIYSCKHDDCDRDMGKNFIWAESTRIENNLDDLRTFYSNEFSSYYYTNQVYWYARVVSDTASYDVSIYAAERTDYRTSPERQAAGRTLVHIQIIGNEAFEADLEFVDASAIEERGVVALYGLFFASGDDQLTAESEPTLAEIAKALDGSPDLSIYVVGHTR